MSSENRDHDREVDESNDRRRNRAAAMRLAEWQAMSGDPICGAFFGFLHSIRGNQMADFMDEFYEVDFEDDSDECRPY